MAVLDKKPNGGHHCEECLREHVLPEACDVKYDRALKRWLCNWCWAETGNPAKSKP
jgi:hypothetical protein